MSEEVDTEIPQLDYQVIASEGRCGGYFDHIFAVSLVECMKKCRRNGKEIIMANASGFFYKHKEKLYFITNRHVVVDDTKNFFPDILRLKLHTDKNDLTHHKRYSIPLYENGKQKWLEHPVWGETVDVVALPVEVPSIFYITPFSKEDLILEGKPGSVYDSIGDDIIVVGYPCGYHDSKNNIPLIRRASLASFYPLPYEGNMYFLIDACLHEGTSGSPVLLKPRPMHLLRRDKSGAHRTAFDNPKKYLIGIHQGEYDKYNNSLNLHIVWFAELIQQIIEARKEQDQKE
jgi:hypothetical protein